MELDDLRMFVATVDAGSFTAAADQLMLSKQFVSRRTMALEASLGVRLLHRNTRKLAVTESGVDFYARAQRILAEAMARELGPKGVHVAYLVIDAVIDLEWTRRMFTDASNEFFITPAAIAEEAWHVAHQDRCAWSFHVEVRPFGEAW